MFWWEQEQKFCGPIQIGDHVKIGAGSIVLKSIQSNCTAVGVPINKIIEHEE